MSETIDTTIPEFLRRKSKPGTPPPTYEIRMPEKKLVDPPKKKPRATHKAAPKAVVAKPKDEVKAPAVMPTKPSIKIETAAETLSDADARKIIKGNIIKSKYKERYKNNGYSCGDVLAEEMREYLFVSRGGKSFVDPERIREVAEANGVWKPSYANLNIGQQRMTVGNCLRAKIKNGESVNIGGAVLDPNERDPGSGRK